MWWIVDESRLDCMIRWQVCLRSLLLGAARQQLIRGLGEQDEWVQDTVTGKVRAYVGRIDWVREPHLKVCRLSIGVEHSFWSLCNLLLNAVVLWLALVFYMLMLQVWHLHPEISYPEILGSVPVHWKAHAWNIPKSSVIYNESPYSMNKIKKNWIVKSQILQQKTFCQRCTNPRAA